MLAWVLFPAIGLATVWPEFGLAVNGMFPTAVAHSIGHFGLHLLLGLVLLATFPRLRSRCWLYLGLMLLVGLAQEALQAPFKGQWLSTDNAYDLSIDTLGALAAVCLTWAWSRTHKRVRTH
jgi:VanZ family protein